MTFNVKMFCVVLISAGLVLSACERKQETAQADAAAEEPKEAAEPDVAAEEPAAEEADTGAEQADASEENADAANEDASAEAAADEAKEDKKQAAKPKTPPMTGNLSSSVGGSGITNGKIKLTIRDDYKVNGSFTGKREDARFIIPLQGVVNKKSDAIVLNGSRDGNTARLTGKVSKGGVSGKISGKIHQKSYSSNINLSK